MSELDAKLVFEGPSVEFRLEVGRPNFGDLLAMIGVKAPDFPPTRGRAWASLAELGFEQADDYFAIPGETDDYCIWLYPVVDGEVVDHHEGPFDALRLSYCVLRNPVSTAQRFYDVLARFTEVTGVAPFYLERGVTLDEPLGLDLLRDDVDAVVAHWKREGIVCGSDEALLVDF